MNNYNQTYQPAMVHSETHDPNLTNKYNNYFDSNNYVSGDPSTNTSTGVDLSRAGSYLLTNRGMHSTNGNTQNGDDVSDGIVVTSVNPSLIPQTQVKGLIEELFDVDHYTPWSAETANLDPFGTALHWAGNTFQQASGYTKNNHFQTLLQGPHRFRPRYFYNAQPILQVILPTDDLFSLTSSNTIGGPQLALTPIFAAAVDFISSDIYRNNATDLRANMTNVSGNATNLLAELLKWDPGNYSTTSAAEPLLKLMIMMQSFNWLDRGGDFILGNFSFFPGAQAWWGLVRPDDTIVYRMFPNSDDINVAQDPHTFEWAMDVNIDCKVGTLADWVSAAADILQAPAGWTFEQIGYAQTQFDYEGIAVVPIREEDLASGQVNLVWTLMFMAGNPWFTTYAGNWGYSTATGVTTYNNAMGAENAMAGMKMQGATRRILYINVDHIGSRNPTFDVLLESANMQLTLHYPTTSWLVPAAVPQDIGPVFADMIGNQLGYQVFEQALQRWYKYFGSSYDEKLVRTIMADISHMLPLKVGAEYHQLNNGYYWEDPGEVNPAPGYTYAELPVDDADFIFRRFLFTSSPIGAPFASTRDDNIQYRTRWFYPASDNSTLLAIAGRQLKYTDKLSARSRAQRTMSSWHYNLEFDAINQTLATDLVAENLSISQSCLFMSVNFITPGFSQIALKQQIILQNVISAKLRSVCCRNQTSELITLSSWRSNTERVGAFAGQTSETTWLHKVVISRLPKQWLMFICDKQIVPKDQTMTNVSTWTSNSKIYDPNTALRYTFDILTQTDRDGIVSSDRVRDELRAIASIGWWSRAEADPLRNFWITDGSLTYVHPKIFLTEHPTSALNLQQKYQTMFAGIINTNVDTFEVVYPDFHLTIDYFHANRKTFLALTGMRGFLVNKGKFLYLGIQSMDESTGMVQPSDEFFDENADSLAFLDGGFRVDL